MKKICIAFFVIMLILSMTLTAAAIPASTVECTEGFYLNKTLFVYLNPSDADDLSKQTISFSDGNSIGSSISAKNILKTDTVVHYLFLVDASDSMPWYSDRTNAVVESIVKNEKQKFTADIATMGESFDVILSDCKEADKVISAAKNIEYTQPVSEICDGILDAISYLRKKQVDGTELLSIVVITDGDTYMSDTGRSPEAIEKIAEATKTSVEKYTEVVIHSVCFGDWNQTTYDAISESRGVHLNAYDESDASDCGAGIAGFTDGLYRAEIPYNKTSLSSRFSGSILLSESNLKGVKEIALSSIKDYNLEEKEPVPAFDDDGNLILRQDEPAGKPSDETVPPTVPTVPATQKPSVISPVIPDPGTVASSDTTEAEAETEIASEPETRASEPATGDEASAADSDSSNGGLPIWVWIIIGVLALTVIVLVIVLLARNKRSPKKEKAAVPAPTPAAAPMPPVPAVSVPAAVDQTPTPTIKTVEPPQPCINIAYRVVCGKAQSMNGELELIKELVIGSDPGCDIVVNDPLVAPRNTKIIFENNSVYIDNYTNQALTYLGGMKVFSRNQLRSGDEISMGNTSIVLKF